MVGPGAAMGQAFAEGGVGRGFSGNEQLGVFCPPFDGCVFTFFCYLVSIVYGTWYEAGWQPTKMVVEV